MHYQKSAKLAWKMKGKTVLYCIVNICINLAGQGINGCNCGHSDNDMLDSITLHTTKIACFKKHP